MSGLKTAIYGQFVYDDASVYTKMLLDTLLEKKCSVCIEASLLAQIKKSSLFTSQHKSLPTFKHLDSSYDFFFSIGGDGTILKSILFVKDLNIPIAGINTGRLGFLAGITKEEVVESVSKIIDGNYTISERSLLQIVIDPDYKSINTQNFALNELSVIRKNTTSMIKVDAYLNNEYLTSYWSDGLIVSTPTGSTGYSLSCGGPILDPKSKNFIITAIAPHNLNARPIVIPDDTEITLKVTAREDNYLVSLDSRITGLTNETTITVKKAPFSMKMIQLNEESFIKTLRKKLMWGEDKRN